MYHTVFTGCCYCIERQQLETDIERLTSDKADLLTRLQCCEEDLKTVNECEIYVIRFFSILILRLVLRMKDKAISGMMATVHRRDTDVEEREDHLKKVIRSQLLSLCVY